MLVLSRKEGETILIDDTIHVTVVRCGKGRVKLGIEAPHGVPIKRAELGDQQRQRGHLPLFVDGAGEFDELRHPTDRVEPLPPEPDWPSSRQSGVCFRQRQRLDGL